MKNLIKRVAAIHDLSGFGRSSLSVVIPILSTLGVQVCSLPTAVLSTHSGFRNPQFKDLTEHMRKIIDHWKHLNIKFDAIYSGFLGSYFQIEIVKDFIKSFGTDTEFIVVDPVLGDKGKMYHTLKENMVNEMRKLIKKADIITPNLTEAHLLLDRKFNNNPGLDEAREIIMQLSQKGPKIVILTGFPESKKRTSVLAYNKEDNRFWRVSCDYLPADYPGTGDSFTSVIVGSLLIGDSLPLALDRAVQFISTGVRATFGYNYNNQEGILLERVLPNLRSPIQNSSYEILEFEK